MKIASFGCSFTLGVELQDYQTVPSVKSSNLTWPALIAKKLQSEYFCFARGGSGNFSTMDRIFLKRELHPDAVMIINWTFIDRFDYSDPDGRHFNKGINGFLTLRPGNNDSIADCYFRNLHSEYKDKLSNLCYISNTIDLLQAKQTKFVMTCVDDLLLCDKWHAPSHVLALQDKIRPYIQSFEGQNFLAWCTKKGFSFGQFGHPLEDAHAAAADLMLPVIESILHKA